MGAQVGPMDPNNSLSDLFFQRCCRRGWERMGPPWSAPITLQSKVLVVTIALKWFVPAIQTNGNCFRPAAVQDKTALGKAHRLGEVHLGRRLRNPRTPLRPARGVEWKAMRERASSPKTKDKLPPQPWEHPRTVVACSAEPFMRLAEPPPLRKLACVRQQWSHSQQVLVNGDAVQRSSDALEETCFDFSTFRLFDFLGLGTGRLTSSGSWPFSGPKGRNDLASRQGSLEHLTQDVLSEKTFSKEVMQLLKSWLTTSHAIQSAWLTLGKRMPQKRGTIDKETP